MRNKTPLVGIVVGQTRDGRFGDKPAYWFHNIAKHCTDMAFELLDLGDYLMPSFVRPAAASAALLQGSAVERWKRKLASLDGLLVVTLKDGDLRGAALQNALAYARREFIDKPIGFVGAGGAGAARAISRLRLADRSSQRAVCPA